MRGIVEQFDSAKKPLLTRLSRKGGYTMARKPSTMPTIAKIRAVMESVSP